MSDRSGILLPIRTMMDARVFYQAEELKLIYTSKEGEVIIDNEIDVWNSGISTIYYSGDWKSPLVLYSLSSMLCDVLQLKDMEREFALILQLSDKEIKQWLIKNSYNITLIEEFGLFVSEYWEESLKEEYSEEISNEVQHEILKVEIFEEKVKVSDIDFSAIAPVQKAVSDIQSSSVVVDYQIIENSKVRTDIGRWSEEYIYEYFKSNPVVFTSVNWLNEEGESNQPYDFEVVENGVERLIEVKGTPSLDKNLIYLSKKEWQVMIETGKAYSIFRVYGAGSESNYMHRIDDVKSLLNDGSIDFTVEMFL